MTLPELRFVSRTRKSLFKGVLTLVFFSVAVAVGCTSKKNVNTGIIIAKSNSYEAALFKQNCAICHGKEAYGKIVNGKQVPSLRTGEAAKKTEKEIYNQIANGKLPMPAFKSQLSDSEIRRMVRFVMVDLQGRNQRASK